MLFSSLRGWPELMTTFDLSVYTKTVQALDRAGIAHHVSTHHTGNGSRRSGSLGALGERAEYGTQYCVYVAKPDWELAKHICQKDFSTT